MPLLTDSVAPSGLDYVTSGSNRGNRVAQYAFEKRSLHQRPIVPKARAVALSGAKKWTKGSDPTRTDVVLWGADHGDVGVTFLRLRPMRGAKRLKMHNNAADGALVISVPHPLRPTRRMILSGPALRNSVTVSSQRSLTCRARAKFSHQPWPLRFWRPCRKTRLQSFRLRPAERP